MHRILWSVMLLFGCGCARSQSAGPVAGGDRLAGKPYASRSSVIARHGMAATAHPLATQIAINTLQQGGSAVDAAIAANAALGFLEPVGCGVGGDLFALVWDPKKKRVVGFNGSGRSPQGRTLEQLKKRLNGAATIPPFGSLAVTVPGAVDAWFQLHQRFGRLPMSEVLGPAIRYAREGVPVPQTIAHYWKANIERLEAYQRSQPWLEELDNARKLFAPGGQAPNEGDVFYNPDLAHTYEVIAKEGRDGFYRGPIARTIDAYMERIGGDLRYDDLVRHRGEWVEALSTSYRGYTVYELPPNTQGLAALQMLAILDGMDIGTSPSAQSIHLQVEAKRIAFEDRAKFYADPAFMTHNPADLLKPEVVAAKRSLIQSGRVRPVEVSDPAVLENGDTTYLTVADESGMMVSLIQSNYRGMGSGLVPDGLGFMLQDRGELFALDNKHSNVYAPAKRPFHTIIPALVTRDGEGWLSFGVMGGGMQPQGHVQILCNLIDFGLNLQEAGDLARWRHDGSPEPTGQAGNKNGTLHVESGIPSSIRMELEAMGHKVEVSKGGYGGYQAIMRDSARGVYYGASERRKDGLALGY